MLFGEEPGFPSLSAAWSYIQNFFEPESPESKDNTLEKEILPWFAAEGEFYNILLFLKESLTIGSLAWPHTQSQGDLVIERLRTLAQALVWAQKTLGFKVASSTSLDRQLCVPSIGCVTQEGLQDPKCLPGARWSTDPGRWSRGISDAPFHPDRMLANAMYGHPECEAGRSGYIYIYICFCRGIIYMNKKYN